MLCSHELCAMEPGKASRQFPGRLALLHCDEGVHCGKAGPEDSAHPARQPRPGLPGTQQPGSHKARVSAACASWTRPMWWWAWMNGTLWSLRRNWWSCCSPSPTARSIIAYCATERTWTGPVTSTADQKFECSWGLATSPFQVWSALKELCYPTERWAVSGLVLNCWWATLFVLFDVVCLVLGSPGPWACDHYRTKLHLSLGLSWEIWTNII